MTEEFRDFIMAGSDKRCLAQLAGFIPQKIFDAHAHLYDTAFLPTMAAPGTLFAEAGDRVDRAAYHRLQAPLYGRDRDIRLNVITTPDGAMADTSNGLRAQSVRFIAEHLHQNPQDVGEVIVLPGDTVKDLKALLAHPNIRGFKCYHVNAAVKPTWQAPIEAYLPESAWRVAEENGLCITLHMVRNHALADADNAHTIVKMAKKYPGAKLILAHAARAFASWTAMAGIHTVAGLPNVYFDVSAVCEPAAIAFLLKATGTGRALWGSDFPVSMQRGKAISIADSFLWLDGPTLEKAASKTAFSANLVGIENLWALWQACRLCDVPKAGVENIFNNNASALFAPNA